MLLFQKDGDLNPSSSLQVMQVGDRAMIHSLIGNGFYDMLNSVGLKPFKEMGVKYVYAAISHAHYRLMSRRLPSGISLELHGTCTINSHTLMWVLLEDVSDETISRQSTDGT